MTTPITEAPRPDWFDGWTDTIVPKLSPNQLEQLRAMTPEDVELAARFPPLAVCRDRDTGRAGIVIGYGQFVENRHGTLCGFIVSSALLQELRARPSPTMPLGARTIPGIALASTPIGEARICGVRADDLEFVALHGPIDASFVQHVHSIVGDA
jgi:hypothetical protein